MRIRRMLFSSLLKQEINFYDEKDTGEITSRLTSDTTKVSDQISLNMNVFLRSSVQAVGVVAFMFSLCWQLTLVTFFSVPIVAILSRV